MSKAIVLWRQWLIYIGGMLMSDHAADTWESGSGSLKKDEKREGERGMRGGGEMVNSIKQHLRILNRNDTKRWRLVKRLRTRRDVYGYKRIFAEIVYILPH